MLTGTIAFSGSGVRPRSSASARRAPAIAARPTSLRVPATPRLTSRTSFKATRCWTSVRRGPSGRFRPDPGACGSRSWESAETSRPASRSASPAVMRGWVAARTTSRAARDVSSAPCSSGSSARCSVVGGASASHGATAGSAPGPAWPSMSIVSSAICSAAAPSAIAWCTRPTTPRRPSASRGTKCSCHSGRPRSSGVESSASRSAAKRSGPTGSSRSVSCTTWAATSKSSSSTQRGSLRPSGAGSRRWRQRGTQPSRRVTRARTSSIDGTAPFSGGEKTALQATCMCAWADSSCRNDASTGDSRSPWPLAGMVPTLPSRARDVKRFPLTGGGSPPDRGVARRRRAGHLQACGP